MASVVSSDASSVASLRAEVFALRSAAESLVAASLAVAGGGSAGSGDFRAAVRKLFDYASLSRAGSTAGARQLISWLSTHSVLLRPLDGAPLRTRESLDGMLDAILKFTDEVARALAVADTTPNSTTQIWLKTRFPCISSEPGRQAKATIKFHWQG